MTDHNPPADPLRQAVEEYLPYLDRLASAYPESRVSVATRATAIDLRRILTEHPTATTSAQPRRMLDSDMRHQVMLLANHARFLAEDPKPAPGESKNIVIPALAQAEAYTDMAVRLEAVRTLTIGQHANNPRFAEIGLDVLADVARYARTRYETPITYTRDEHALAHSGRCKAYRDMAERVEALLNGTGE